MSFSENLKRSERLQAEQTRAIIGYCYEVIQIWLRHSSLLSIRVHFNQQSSLNFCDRPRTFNLWNEFWEIKTRLVVFLTLEQAHKHKYSFISWLSSVDRSFVTNFCKMLVNLTCSWRPNVWHNDSTNVLHNVLQDTFLAHKLLVSL